MRSYLNIPLCVLFVLAVCSIGQAQSGRRAPKPLSPPTTTPPPPTESEPPPPPTKPALKQQTLVVGMDSGSLYIPQYMSDAVWAGFIDRFRGVSSIMITTDKNMNRKKASDRAKKERESFVVLLQLGTEDISASIGQVNPDDLVVSYFIFSPGTGKAQEQGRVYLRSYRGILGKRLPTDRTGQRQLNDAGRETAGRVMSALHIGDTAIMH